MEILSLYTLAFIGGLMIGYMVGHSKATTKADEIRRWWYERQKRNGL
jgi:ABC-type cobalt transport system substrate-binding protein